jgi:hypothetical protein
VPCFLPPLQLRKIFDLVVPKQKIDIMDDFWPFKPRALHAIAWATLEVLAGGC